MPKRIGIDAPSELQGTVATAVERALSSVLNSIDNRVTRSPHWQCPRCGWVHVVGNATIQGFGDAFRCNCCGEWTRTHDR